MSEQAQEPILVAVDFSPDSEAAFIWATRAAKRFDTSLAVVHVVHDPESAPGYYAMKDASGRLVTMEEAARVLLDKFLARMTAHPQAAQGVEMTPHMTTGLPANRILEIAKATGAQQIVVGSKGRTGLEHLLLGSKAERVAQLSPIPVTIVKRDFMEQ
ncbi:MAG: universal stress protein [bacterium]|nr:universal stress protein [bacterium]